MEQTKLYRQTRQRQRILQLLRGTEVHPTADWIYAQMKQEFPRLSLGTIYRNLNILITQGLVRKIHSGSTFDRFEANMTNHYHLICESCGRIMDLDMNVQKELEDLAGQLTDFTITKHQINFFGICSDCKH